MTVRRFAMLVTLVTLATTGFYFFYSLYRWEWNRAQISALTFIGAEVMFVSWMLNERLRDIRQRLAAVEQQQREQIRSRLRETAPEPHRPFAWLTSTDRATVFLPVLLGAGVILSAAAWIVERIGRATVSPRMERKLAGRLADAVPAPKLLADSDDLELLRGPVRRSR